MAGHADAAAAADVTCQMSWKLVVRDGNGLNKKG